MTVRLLQGDCREVLKTLPTASVHMCCTSPPYYKLRDYGDADQIGQEKTLPEYVAQIVKVMRRVKRVLRDDGTLWLNLGDSFAKNKQLLGVPWQVAFSLQADGWILRRDIVWHKTNAMPESMSDRPFTAHEYVFMFSKQGRHYFYDADAVREAKGGNVRSVWPIATSTYAGAHFATFPPKLASRCIKAGTSMKGVCPTCGTPWRRVVEEVKREKKWGASTRADAPGAVVSPSSIFRTGVQVTRETVGWKEGCTCAEAANVIPAVVLDPFGGAGTTSVAAERLQRDSVYIDLYAENVAMARNRLYGDAPLFARIIGETAHG